MQTLQGIAAAPGVGVGQVYLFEQPQLTYSEAAHGTEEAEQARLDGAIAAFVLAANTRSETATQEGAKDTAEIFQAHTVMAQDPALASAAAALVRAGKSAEAAIVGAAAQMADLLESVGDEMMAARAADVRDVGQGVLANLLGAELPDLRFVPTNCVVVAHDLAPSACAGLSAGNVCGIVCEEGGATSHVALIARSLNIPCVLGAEGALAAAGADGVAIVDGTAGSVVFGPTQAQLEQAQATVQAASEERARLEAYRGRQLTGPTGRRVALHANVGSAAEVAAAMQADAEGVGLFRTEFMFMGKSVAPSEQAQFEEYRQALENAQGKTVIIRTLDAGADKDIPYLNLEREDNPFLGLRGIRLCLARPELFRTQLRALLRAAVYGKLRIMIPLVTSVQEVQETAKLLVGCAAELEAEGVPHNAHVELGIMVETPAAVTLAPQLAAVSDFFSLGTNDLTGYTLCVDRGNPHVSHLFNTAHPAVLAAVQQVAQAAHDANIPVGMCGAAAANPALLPYWLEYGIDELSVPAAEVLPLRKRISER